MTVHLFQNHLLIEVFLSHWMDLSSWLKVNWSYIYGNITVFLEPWLSFSYISLLMLILLSEWGGLDRHIFSCFSCFLSPSHICSLYPSCSSPSCFSSPLPTLSPLLSQDCFAYYRSMLSNMLAICPMWLWALKMQLSWLRCDARIKYTLISKHRLKTM